MAVKNVTGSEEFFEGHFPGAPVMPGVLILEAMEGDQTLFTREDEVERAWSGEGAVSVRAVGSGISQSAHLGRRTRQAWQGYALAELRTYLRGRVIPCRSLTRRAAQREARMEQQASGEVYVVRDNGAGFDMAFADRLFNPFERLHHQDDFDGTGVGLATVKRIVRRHGGKIWAEATAGHGAAFFFTLGEE